MPAATQFSAAAARPLVRRPAAAARADAAPPAPAAPAPRGSRRAALGGLAAAAAALAARAPPAAAGLFGPSAEEAYKAETGALISALAAAVALDKADPGREAALRGVRDASAGWVAKYRREPAYGGRASYGAAYTAVNSLAGHLNSFGYAAAIPKKRLDRIAKELDDASRALERGR